MQLTILDRMLVLGVLPKEGRFKDLKVADGIRDLLELDDNEMETWKDSNLAKRSVAPDGTRMSATVREFVFTDKAMTMLEAQLKELEAAGKLGAAYVDLYEQIVVRPEDADNQQAVRDAEEIVAGRQTEV